jgi:hypothetical protein
MRLFILFELVFMAAVLYLIVNLGRYLFFRETRGGKLFGLSDEWIKNDKRKGVEK